MHINADYPDSLALDTSPENIALKSSDHDLPLVVINLDDTDLSEDPTPTPISYPASPAPQIPSWLWLVIASIFGAIVAILTMLFLQRRKSNA